MSITRTAAIKASANSQLFIHLFLYFFSIFVVKIHLLGRPRNVWFGCTTNNVNWAQRIISCLLVQTQNSWIWRIIYLSVRSNKKHCIRKPTLCDRVSAYGFIQSTSSLTQACICSLAPLVPWKLLYSPHPCQTKNHFPLTTWWVEINYQGNFQVFCTQI